ncbi:MAG: NAD-dependent epimerase/dehydratase family protein, partial [Bacteroidetes bacterium]|nr:NAD-dependent epimerase/dehydratase family protein [Bacteroidota bacterium]
MKILITGVAGFAGNSIAKTLLHHHSNLQIIGLDNFSRKGSELNISDLTSLEIDLIRGDIRSQSDIDCLPKVDWVIDCAANPSVLAGIDGQSSSRQLLEHNLIGTINLLEYCKNHKAGLILLSTSRVYSASELAALPVKSSEDRFELQDCDISGASSLGISEDFPTTAPLSLYGASKLASETLILEYGECF